MFGGWKDEKGRCYFVGQYRADAKYFVVVNFLGE
jgi:hypothetical protein